MRLKPRDAVAVKWENAGKTNRAKSCPLPEIIPLAPNARCSCLPCPGRIPPDAASASPDRILIEGVSHAVPTVG